ncbi:MAG: tRNA uridine-5-carboxymethylaminomethyl(34) synthesis GTPase MnmE [Bacteroidales bacterium]|jgi:tRNA modification GTPase|nr:tRNA uridine-5-carboxymethylaminomethyl(34) synthesis GTPase MnmE [Bacteroidales bacterium]
MNMQDTICALATPSGTGAIALIRVSGKRSWNTVKDCFVSKRNTIIIPRTVYFGEFYHGETILDYVLVTYFKHPHSFTGEDMVEISCHGSVYIQKQIMEILIDKGCRCAKAGEFTMRAFLNGKMDLSQAEAIADVIASNSKASLELAMTNLRGGVSNVIKKLREQLLHFVSLLELELDFSEEDVEFADRQSMKQLMTDLHSEIEMLVHSFSTGNAVKNGFPVAIVGYPNAGKSTLLNTLLNEERAIVSEIPGTTRDTIEDTMIIDGQTFRFIDTAGIRKSQDEIEQYGIERTYQSIDKAMIVLYVIDALQMENTDNITQIDDILQTTNGNGKKWLIVANKSDLLQEQEKTKVKNKYKELEIVYLSAKYKTNIHILVNKLKEEIMSSTCKGDVLVSNVRHYEALKQSLDALQQAETAFDNHLPTDLIATDIRQVLYYLGEVVGDISNEEILDSIFSKFCIGK